MTTVARTINMARLTGIDGIIGYVIQPHPGGNPSIHHPMPAIGRSINQGIAGNHTRHACGCVGN